ncbi:hypothetical protein [Erwinia aphidicola]|uniref:hypothetical protein n=1 Tax=Erwinia aphidicola TaxID=68334 RepID=UPI0030D4F8B3
MKRLFMLLAATLLLLTIVSLLSMRTTSHPISYQNHLINKLKLFPQALMGDDCAGDMRFFNRCRSVIAKTSLKM